MARCGLVIGLTLAAVAAALDNGLGITPPRGWRSWNAFGCDGGPETILTQEHMRAQMLALVDKSRTVDGRPTSLAELGYDYVSMDDGWQRCNCSSRKSPNASQPECPIKHGCFNGGCSWHDPATGWPLIRQDRFPDMKGMVDFGHSLGIKVGTYLNTCICMEAGASLPHYREDVKWMVEHGFDEVKIDACGTSHNVSFYADLLNASGRPVRIENCHNSWPDFKTGFCPMNFFRSGGDISASIDSILGEAYSTVDASDLVETRSRPGCWAYPDMSEVGNFPEGDHQLEKERTHWSLWSIVSSPLILGFDMNISAKMDRAWPLITNRDALSVSEAWAGHPGTLIRTYEADGGDLQVAVGECDGSQSTLGWQFHNGNLVAPNPHASPSPQCVNYPRDSPCPPPTTYYSDGQCGLLLSDCVNMTTRWALNGTAVQYVSRGQHPSQCLYAVPLNFDITKGFYTRQAAIVRLMNCPPSAAVGQTAQSRAKSSPIARGGHAAEPQDECELVKKARSVPRTEQLSKSRVRSPASQAAFNLTEKGELRTADGKCLRAAPGSGVQLWAKPMSSSQVAIVLVNPLKQNQTFSLPLADVPRRFHGSITSGPDFSCVAGSCTARDLWTKEETLLTSEALTVTLQPYASAFYILRSRSAEVEGEVLISV